MGHEVSIQECHTENLCQTVWGGVSHSGATVLHLVLKLSSGESLDLAVKILCPDSVNLFKLDKDFSGRRDEITWARWWEANSRFIADFL